MKARSTFFLLYIAWIIAAAMLVFAAAEKQPDSFYTLLRWICRAVFAYSAVAFFQWKCLLWLCILVVLAVLFNPISRLGLVGNSWLVANLFSMGRMVGAACLFLT